MKTSKLLILIPTLLFASCQNGNLDSTSSSLSISSHENSSVNTFSTNESIDNASSGDNISSNNNTSNELVSSASSSISDKVSSSEKQSSSSKSSSSEDETSSFDDEEVITTTGGELPSDLSDVIYLSPKGSDSNPGTNSAPLYSLSSAVSKAKAGSVIMMKEGTYAYSSRIDLAISGTKEKPIYIQAEDYKKVILDFRNQAYGKNSSQYVGLYLTGDYWKIQGLEIMYAGDNAIKVEGSYNYIGRCVTHHNGDTGIQLGFGHSYNNTDGLDCAYNTVENCDSYLNYDYDNHQDADGFACKMHPGMGNVFKGCRAWYNCDDAWDLYETDHRVTLIDCWAMHSAKKEYFTDFDEDYLTKNNVKIGSMGNGNGIKLGGNGSGGSSKGQNLVKNCVAFGCDITGSVKGFDENNHKEGNIVENCVAWDNGYNYMFENGTEKNSLFKNCISFRTSNGLQKENKLTAEFEKGSKIENCNFEYEDGIPGNDIIINLKITADDFITIDINDALAERESDGSLPNNGFARLKETTTAYSLGLGLK